MTAHTAEYLISTYKLFTRKPSGAYLWVKGEIGCLSTYINNAVQTQGYDVSTMESGENALQLNGRTFPVFVVEDDGKYQLFQFVNSLGVVENIAARTLESLSYTTETEELNRIGKSSFALSMEKRMAYKSAPYAGIKMSSGPVNRLWADWWANEFLLSEKVWLRRNGKWLPVMIKPEDSNSIYSRSEPGLLHVDFTVKPVFSGSIDSYFV